MPVLTFDKILKIISTILSILSYAIALLNGDKVSDDAAADA